MHVVIPYTDFTYIRYGVRHMMMGLAGAKAGTTACTQRLRKQKQLAEAKAELREDEENCFVLSVRGFRCVNCRQCGPDDGVKQAYPVW